MVYIGTGENEGRKIPEDCAVDYAMEQCGISFDMFAPMARLFCTARSNDVNDFEETVKDWFFSSWDISYEDE